MRKIRFSGMLLATCWTALVTGVLAEPVRVGTFEVDASPPVGSPLAYDDMKGVQTPLSCRGVVIVGSGKPIVLCAIDWIGLSNDGHLHFRQGLAAGAGTEIQRVAVHALHQHDAPACDFSAEALLAEHGLKGGGGFDADHARKVIEAASQAVARAIENAQPVTHLGLGAAEVENVASNRRILGEDGKVLHTRWTATQDETVRGFPAGTIDPLVRLVSFWDESEAVAVLSYYATHPQSYYRTGLANPDFPGLARNARQKATGVPHIHFNGAGGNIGAGKWNDGSRENRQVLADRVAAGMERAWKNTKRSPLRAEEVAWMVEPVVLPLGEHMDEEGLAMVVSDPGLDPRIRFWKACNLAWVRRCKKGEPLELACLTLKNARLLNLPGELFVEYQLNAQKLRPDLFVAAASYGDYAPGYICTKIAYSQGGYEASKGASTVAPEVEGVMMDAIRKLLVVEP